MNLVLPLSSLTRSDLPVAGGKGANLGEMIHAGLPVPGGFCVTTQAYRAFVSANRLENALLEQCAGVSPSDPAALDEVSARIRALFEQADLPSELEAAIRLAYQPYANDSVAVRSSATAEDLPDLSFAGQQDTFLNIRGEGELLKAVVRCWSSLWTARAIGYRARNHIPNADLALAVVVQLMVPSEVSGVLFTANPLTGKRHETVINATFGLGEALVSGQVEPDQYIFDLQKKSIISKSLGSKSLSIRGLAGGGVAAQSEDAAQRQALADEPIQHLAELGQKAAAHFGAPQDIEWGLANGKLHLLQSRPITSLYPLPQGYPQPGGELIAWFAFSSWQVMPDPFSPLGRDFFAMLATSAGSHFGATWTLQDQPVFVEAGERLFVDMNGVLQTDPLRKFFPYAIQSISASAGKAMQELVASDRIPVKKSRPSLKTRLNIAQLALRALYTVLINLINPPAGRKRLFRRRAQISQTITKTLQPALPSISARLDRIQKIPPPIMPELFSLLVPAVASGQIPYQGLQRLFSTVPEGPTLSNEIARGLPNNETTDMDLELWRVSRRIHADPHCASVFARSAEQIAQDYKAGALPPAIQAVLADFLSRYGMRGPGEIDMARPRWGDDPTPLLLTLQGYLQQEEGPNSPEKIFARSAQRREEVLKQLIAALRRQPGGWYKAPLARFLASRLVELTGLRESPKFTVVQVMAHFRREFLDIGAELTRTGILRQAEDIFFLHEWEIRQIDAQPAPNPQVWQALIEQRQEDNARELRRRQLPQLLISDGTAVYESLPASSEQGLAGTPVSPGAVEGRVVVALRATEAHLSPGDILVCPATDPSWTPLFLTAGGLIMEIGGLMTHGSVVAREYGIPAVVGVVQATQLLHTGQRVRLDGSAGIIQIIE